MPPDTPPQLDLDVMACAWLAEKIRQDDRYAQNFYAALCNQTWQKQDLWEVLCNRAWSCSWRSAGGIVADIRGEGDYMDWYCSGMVTSHPDDDLDPDPGRGHVPEGTVTDEIRADLAQIGWQPQVDQ